MVHFAEEWMPIKALQPPHEHAVIWCSLQIKVKTDVFEKLLAKKGRKGFWHHLKQSSPSAKRV